MFRAAIVVGVLLASGVASADVTVVVSGQKAAAAATEPVLTAWLTSHDFTVKPGGMPRDGASALDVCLLAGDLTCARGVVDARATAENVIAVVTSTSGPKAHPTIQLASYWIRKGHDGVSMQRTCDDCSNDKLPATIDALMVELAQLTPDMRGRVKVISTPPGVLAYVDDAVVGVTPVEREVAAGPHEVRLDRDNVVLAKRHVDVAPTETVEAEIAVAPVPVAAQPRVIIEHRSRAVPAALLIVGGAAIAAGAVMYVKGGPTGDSFYYRNFRTPGIGVMAGGGACAILGTILMLRGGTTQTPVVAIARDGVFAGWARSF